MRIIVQSYCPRMGQSKRVQDMIHSKLVQCPSCLQSFKIIKGLIGTLIGIHERVNPVVIRNQRMEPIDRDKFLSESVSDAMVINWGTWNPAQRLTFTQSTEPFLYFFSEQTPPVRVHSNL